MPSLTVNWNIAQATWDMIAHDRKNRRVFISILAISWFWLIGATFLSQFPTYAKDVIGGDETVVTLFLTVFSVGIGIGSLLCSRLLKGEVSSRFVPHAALGITLFTIDLFFASSRAPQLLAGSLMTIQDFLGYVSGWRVLFDLMGIAICGGLYIVPLYAIMQHCSDADSRARTIASNNVINSLFMVVSAMATVGMLTAGFTVPHVFLTIGIVNAGVAAYMFRYKRENP